MSKYVLLACLFCWVGKPVFAQEADMNPNSFLRTAIETGLRQDKFPLEMVQKILDNQPIFFVGKCPICTPVKQGFADYARTKTTFKKTKTPQTILENLASADKTTQQIGLRELVERYTSKAFQKLDASPEIKAKLKQDLEKDRKIGMGRKSDSFGDFCPSCDGTCKPKQ
jgi:hypothetical protein